MRRIPLRILTLATALALLWAAPATATPPDQFEDPFHVVIEDLEGEQCGFPIQWVIDGTAFVKVYFDSSGDVVRMHAHVEEDNTIRRLDTGEVVRDGPVVFNDRIDFLADGSETSTRAGIFGNAGRGRDQVNNIGRFVWLISEEGREVLFAAGQTDLLDQSEAGDFQEWLGAFCGLF